MGVGSIPPVISAGGDGVRATVIGAGQFSSQVSGSTIFVTDPEMLPRSDVAVARPAMTSLEPGSAANVADVISDAINRSLPRIRDGLPVLAFSWQGPPDYARVRALADGIALALERFDLRGEAMVLAVDADLGMTLGRILTDELLVPYGLVCIDGVALEEFDYVDLGEVMFPSGAIPLVVKSLVFPEHGETDPQRSTEQPVGATTAPEMRT